MGMFDKMFGKNTGGLGNPVRKMVDSIPAVANSNVAENKEENDRISKELIQKLKLEIGKRISLLKTTLDLSAPGAMDSFVQIQPGTGMSGKLKKQVELGECIELTNMGQTSPIKRIYTENGKTLIQTQTSIYEITTQEQMEEIESKLIKEFGLDTVGKEFSLQKVAKSPSAQSNVKTVGSENMWGKLKEPVEIGKPIYLSDGGVVYPTGKYESISDATRIGDSQTSNVEGVFKKNGKLYIQESSYIYELVNKEEVKG